MCPNVVLSHAVFLCGGLWEVMPLPFSIERISQCAPHLWTPWNIKEVGPWTFIGFICCSFHFIFSLILFAYEGSCSQSPEERVGFSITGITGGCELPDMGAGNWNPSSVRACTFLKFMCIGVFPACMGVSDPLELELQIVAWASMWVLGIEHGSSGRAVCAFNSWAVSPACTLRHWVSLLLVIHNTPHR